MMQCLNILWLGHTICRLDCTKSCFILKAAECADFYINIQESPKMVFDSPLRTLYKFLCTHQYWVVTNYGTFWGPADLCSTQNTSGKLSSYKAVGQNWSFFPSHMFIIFLLVVWWSDKQHWIQKRNLLQKSLPCPVFSHVVTGAQCGLLC
jgi:hypothetical protein